MRIFCLDVDLFAICKATAVQKAEIRASYTEIPPAEWRMALIR